jgi:type VI secretion system secreted protein VgrG
MASMTDLSGIQSALAGAAQDFVDGLLGDLLGHSPHQHTRLLRLHTPLGADVLLAERAQITEGIGPHPSQPTFAIELLALSTRADIQPVDLIGQPVLLELLTAHSTTALRPFHGHVMAFELMGADGGYARYRLQIGTWLDFLRHRTDSWVFQDQSVIDITEAVLADYAAQGALQTNWRWDLKQPDAYPRLSTLAQHAETDFDFLQRLWASNGLFCWFEHEGNPSDPASLGQHTLVIADHNGALTPNAQGRIRYTQSGAAMKEDSITQWHGTRRVGVSTLNMGSFDYRCVVNHTASADADQAHDQPMPLVHNDQPGAYAFETPEEAERLAAVYLQSLEAQRWRRPPPSCWPITASTMPTWAMSAKTPPASLY